MGNLGGYQVITTVAKKVGGPIALTGLTLLTGYIIGRSGEAGIKVGIKSIKRRVAGTKKIKQLGCRYKGMIFDVTQTRKDSSGLEFYVGEQYRVLESDGDAFLIEKIGDDNSPYFISLDFLKTISDIKKEGENHDS